ncbi:MAG: DUF2285 domain-containing protein [Rhodospirillaceae bacterium]|nr:DUF2285 domain-containing protein [Rhodospirillaceae bacterium]
MANLERNLFQELSEKALLRLGSAGWAWEWLRRNPEYARGVNNSLGLTRHMLREHPYLEMLELQTHYHDEWGLCFPEVHSRPYTNAAIFWRPEYDPSVIPVAAVAPASHGSEALDFRDLNFAVRILKAPDSEHVLLSNGFHSIQIHVISGTVLDGPVRLAYVLSEPETLRARRLPVERLVALQKQKRFPARMFSTDSYASRWLLALKAIDMERAGVSQPDIAIQLYNGTRDAGFATDWRRSRLRRLLDTGHGMITGDYLKILARSVKPGRPAP